MFPDHEKFKEAAHIGEELFNDESSELERNCQCIQRGLEQKLFTMEAGLKAYGVTIKEYEQYLGKDLANLLSAYVATNEALINDSIFIHVISYMVGHISKPQNDRYNLDPVIKALGKLSEEVEQKHAHQED